MSLYPGQSITAAQASIAKIIYSRGRLVACQQFLITVRRKRPDAEVLRFLQISLSCLSERSEVSGENPADIQRYVDAY